MGQLRDIGDGGTTALSEEIADRLRGRLAEKRIRQTEVMFATKWSKTTAYRKMNGKSPLDTDELSALWQAFGISPVFLLTGDKDNRPFPGGDGDQVSERSGVQTPEGAPAPRHLKIVHG
jgi:transcriptional regulator with XRE-family HTH domain